MANLLQALILVLVFIAQPLSAADKPPDCSQCHDKLVMASHQGLECVDCHEAIKAFPHPEKAEKPSCKACHPDTDKIFASSAHKAKNLDCKSCHAVHGTAPAKKTCAACHKSVSHNRLPSKKKHLDAAACVICHARATAGRVDVEIGLPKDGAIKRELADPDKNNHIDQKEWNNLQTLLKQRFDGSYLLTKRYNAKSDAHAVTAKTPQCATCHGKENIFTQAQVKVTGKEPFVLPADPKIFTPEMKDVESYQQSVHGRLGIKCVDCHQSQKTPDDKVCASCHDVAYGQFKSSVHGSVGEKASCKGCHGSHTVQEAKTLKDTVCSKCHKDVYEEYKSGIHARTTIAGKEAATCFDCHGKGHTILAKSSPGSSINAKNLPRTCANCHSNVQLMTKYKLPAENVYALYMDSIHGKTMAKPGGPPSAECNDCHGAHAIKAPDDPTSTIFPANIPATCGKCHSREDKMFAGSIHGQQLKKGNSGAPSCASCHRPHQVRQVKAAAWVLDTIKECGSCHSALLNTYRHTYHGKITSLGFTRVAKCADCHGAHDILPQSDPQSRISKKNLLSTCRACHPKANEKFTRFYVHADYKEKGDFPLLHYVWLFMTALLFVVFGFFGIHTLLWLPRSWIERLKKRKGERKK